MKPTVILLTLILFAALILTLLDHTGGPRFSRLPPEAPLSDIQYEHLSGRAPDFTFTTLDGHKKSLRDFRGKTVLLNFWATWCLPCITELPDMISRIDREKGNLVLIALSSDENNKTISDFLVRLPEARQKQIASAFIFIARDPGRAITRNLFATVKYPETVIIDTDGHQKLKIIGAPDWNTLDLNALVAP